MAGISRPPASRAASRQRAERVPIAKLITVALPTRNSVHSRPGRYVATGAGK